MIKISFSNSPFQIITLTYVVISLVFAFLYWLPPFHYGKLSFIDAWFISSSALSTTGLVTVNLSETFTPAATWLMVLEMQLGGIGIMGTVGFYLFLLQKNASLPQLTLMGLDQNQRSLKNVKRLVIFIVLFSLITEAVGFAFFFPEIASRNDDLFSAFRLTVFHSVSSFTHTGFDLFGGTLTAFAAEPVFLIVTAALVFLGGIGFPTVWELIFLRNKKKSLYTKVNLFVHGLLLVGGVVLLSLLEWMNAKTIGTMDIGHKLSNLLFVSVNARNGGFASLDFSQLAPASIMLLLVLMFIGGSASSCAGGIRTSTFAILAAKTFSAFRRKQDVVLFRKSLYEEDVSKAYLVFMLVLALFLIATFMLYIFEPQLDPMHLTFEAMSALTNTGFSLGATSDLSSEAKVFITLLMIIGRIGIISIIYSVVKPRKSGVKYVKESIIVG